jgi:glutamate carboxypeptidase
MVMDDLLRRVKANEPRLRARLRAMVEVESPSDDKAAVDNAGMQLQRWLNASKCKLKTHRMRSFGNVLELKFGPKNAKNRILLLGHLDTVWPIGTLKSMPWRVSAGKIYGPGVLDMKAGVIMALEAIDVLQSLGLSPPVTLLLNSDEEVGSPVSRPITERIALKAKAVLVLEPAQGLAFKTARKGIGHYNLRVEGVASHAGVDFEKGHSAVLEMMRLAHKIASLTALERGLTANIGTIHGGTRSNVVAAECTAEVDVRIAKAADAKRVERFFRSLKTQDKACRLTVTGGMNRPPMERKAGTITLFRTAQRLAAEMGLDLQEAATGGGSDGNFTAALNVPTLDGMGAVGAGAHAANEHVVAKHLVERTALLAGMIATISRS